MCLVLKKPIVAREGIRDYLDGARLICLTNTCEESCQVMRHLNLVQVDTLLKATYFLTIFDLSDFHVLTCCEN